jgi:hypothetical protein
VPASAVPTLFITYTDDVAPVIVPALFDHRYVKFVPVADTLKLAADPTHTAVDTGAEVITTGVFTVTTALPLVTVAQPPALDTTT